MQVAADDADCTHLCVCVSKRSFIFKGTDVYNRLLMLGERGVKFGINQDGGSSLGYNAWESQNLADRGYADVRRLNFTRLLGGGVLHTKSWLADERSFYLGLQL